MNSSPSLPGKVYLIGAGPGAQDLMTLRGARLLAQADVVLHDALVTEEMLELCPQAQKILVGKRCGQLSTAQAFINKQLVDNARKHAIVVRLKGGDPMLFGRADEELRALEEAGIAVEVVPGITTALAAAAATQQPLTKRGVSRSVAFFTSSTAPGEPDQTRRSAELWRFFEFASYLGGAVALVVGGVLILSTFSTAGLRWNMALSVALVAPLYGGFFGLVARVLRFRVEGGAL